MQTSFRTLFICIFIYGSLSAQPRKRQPDTALYAPTVMIELFSSEGCSSCPLADAFMKEILDITDSFNTSVYVADFHVDIWNKGGWADPFSDSLYSKRQKNYTVVLYKPQLYTPMAVINGIEIWPGTAKPEIGKTLRQVMTKPSHHFIRNQASVNEEGDQLTLAHTIWGNYDSCVLQVAIVQKEVKSAVGGGENAGKTLTHHDVVKIFRTFPVYTDKELNHIPIPKGMDLSQYRVLSYLQHQRTGEIFASDQVLFRR